MSSRQIGISDPVQQPLLRAKTARYSFKIMGNDRFEKSKLYICILIKNHLRFA